MWDTVVHERLRQARLSRGEELAEIARRIGVREGLLLMIEAGRFAELPRGIYGRAAIRTYAAALALPADEIVALCEPLLSPLDDPIDGLARVRGLRVSKSEPLRPARAEQPAASNQPLDWRVIAAAAADAGIIVAMLLLVVVITLTVYEMPASALNRTTAPAFAIMGLLLAGSYFVCFGGIASSTLGERLLGLAVENELQDRRPCDLRLVLTRALKCASRDLSFISLLGARCAAIAGVHKVLALRERHS